MSERTNGRIRTVVVDDDWLLRHATSMLLKHEPDIQVVGTAKDGVGALDKIHALQPDLVVTALEMPDMGGIELAFLLRRRFPALGIVAVGNVHEPEITDLCGLCGVDVLMSKALLPAKLPNVLRMVFAARKRVQKRRGCARYASVWNPTT
jgi:DNA-binding NarL/FixJ family response regulator